MKKESKDLVSIIIPTYSRPLFLKRAIKSVLNQTYKAIEIIVVDDNNPSSRFRKETEVVMEEFLDNSKVVYIKHSKNKNGAAARNTGLKRSNGNYIALLDDDDEFHTTKIEKQINLLHNLDPSWGGVYCNYQQLLNNQVIGKYRNKEEGNLLESLLLCKNSICGGSTLLLRKDVFLELKGFDTSFKRNQDWELLVRFFRKFKLALAQDILVNIHMDSRINNQISQDAIITKERFLSVFADDINSLSTKNEIYKRQWFTLGLSFIESSKNYYAIQSFKRGNAFLKLSMKDYIHISISWMNKYFPIKNFLKTLLQ